MVGVYGPGKPMAVLGNRRPVRGAVIIGALSKKTSARIVKALGEKPTPRAEDTVVVQVKGDPRSAVAEIQGIVGTEGLVAPLLEDDAGNELIPTGGIQVRFKEEPSEKKLASFAGRHGVQLARRSKWERSQVEFRPENDDGRFLLDILEDIAADDGVQDTWADVRSSFTKAR